MMEHPVPVLWELVERPIACHGVGLEISIGQRLAVGKKSWWGSRKRQEEIETFEEKLKPSKTNWPPLSFTTSSIHDIGGLQRNGCLCPRVIHRSSPVLGGAERWELVGAGETAGQQPDDPQWHVLSCHHLGVLWPSEHRKWLLLGPCLPKIMQTSFVGNPHLESFGGRESRKYGSRLAMLTQHKPIIGLCRQWQHRGVWWRHLFDKMGILRKISFTL